MSRCSQMTRSPSMGRSCSQWSPRDAIRHVGVRDGVIPTETESPSAFGQDSGDAFLDGRDRRRTDRDLEIPFIAQTRVVAKIQPRLGTGIRRRRLESRPDGGWGLGGPPKIRGVFVPRHSHDRSRRHCTASLSDDVNPCLGTPVPTVGQRVRLHWSTLSFRKRGGPDVDESNSGGSRLVGALSP